MGVRGQGLLSYGVCVCVGGGDHCELRGVGGGVGLRNRKVVPGKTWGQCSEASGVCGEGGTKLQRRAWKDLVPQCAWVWWGEGRKGGGQARARSSRTVIPSSLLVFVICVL